MLKVVVDYPTEAQEQDILSRVQHGFRAQNLDTAEIHPALQGPDLPHFQAEVERVQVDAAVQHYIVQIARATRQNRHLLLGASPRAAITLLLTTKALAAVRGRDFVTPDDVKRMARPVLCHRLLVKPESEIEGFTSERVIETVLQETEVPR
jgi:MoxR-like ATPase